MNPANRTSRPANGDLTADTVADEALGHPAALFVSRADKVRLEAENGLIQFDEVCQLVSDNPTPGVLSVNPALIRRFQYLAIQNIYACAGQFRTDGVRISNTVHQPPPHDRVPWLVQEMCDVANRRTDWPPIRTAAYLLWRHNWIHPFFGGNGRTSRALAYYALGARVGLVIPGQSTIPELIVANRQRYYDALDQADAADREGTLALGPMEQYLSELLARQLTTAPDPEENAEYLATIYEVATTPPSP